MELAQKRGTKSHEPDRVIVRLLTPADRDAFRDLREEALRLEPRAFGASSEEHGRLSPEEIAARLRGQLVFGGFEGEALVAIAGCYQHPQNKVRHKGLIWGVYVTPSHRGRGLARAVLEALIAEARRTEGIEQLMLSVACDNRGAARLYRSLGFTTYGVERRALKVGRDYVDEEWMALYF